MVQEIIITGLGISNVVTGACLLREKKKYKALSKEHDALNSFASGALGYNALESMFEYMTNNNVGLDYWFLSAEEQVKALEEAKEAKKEEEKPMPKVNRRQSKGAPNPVLQG